MRLLYPHNSIVYSTGDWCYMRAGTQACREQESATEVVLASQASAQREPTPAQERVIK